MHALFFSFFVALLLTRDQKADRARSARAKDDDVQNMIRNNKSSTLSMTSKGVKGIFRNAGREKRQRKMLKMVRKQAKKAQEKKARAINLLSKRREDVHRAHGHMQSHDA